MLAARSGEFKSNATFVTRALRFRRDECAARRRMKIRVGQILFRNFRERSTDLFPRAAHSSRRKRSAREEIEGASSAPTKMRRKERKGKTEAEFFLAISASVVRIEMPPNAPSKSRFRKTNPPRGIWGRSGAFGGRCGARGGGWGRSGHLASCVAARATPCYRMERHATGYYSTRDCAKRTQLPKSLHKPRDENHLQHSHAHEPHASAPASSSNGTLLNTRPTVARSICGPPVPVGLLHKKWATHLPSAENFCSCTSFA